MGERKATMTYEAAEKGQLEARLERLERQNRRMRVALGVVAAGVVAGGLIAASFRDDKGAGAATSRLRIVEAEQVVLRDADGQMRAWLGLADGGPRLLFFDAAGQQRVGLGLSAQAEPSLGIFDGAQMPRVVLGMVDGWPGLVVRDPAGRKRAVLHAQEEWSSLFFFDRRETRRAGIGALADGAAVNLCDDRGRDRAGLTVESTGASLSFFDSRSRKRLGVGLVRSDEPAIGAFDASGLPLATLETPSAKTEWKLYGTNRCEAAVSAGVDGPRVDLAAPDGKRVGGLP
jgi:hypothetical protein